MRLIEFENAFEGELEWSFVVWRVHEMRLDEAGDSRGGDGD